MPFRHIGREEQNNFLLIHLLCRALMTTAGSPDLFNARRSLGRRPFATSAEGANLEVLVLRHHDGQDLENVLGHGIIVDADQ